MSSDGGHSDSFSTDPGGLSDHGCIIEYLQDRLMCKIHEAARVMLPHCLFDDLSASDDDELPILNNSWDLEASSERLKNALAILSRRIYNMRHRIPIELTEFRRPFTIRHAELSTAVEWERNTRPGDQAIPHLVENLEGEWRRLLRIEQLVINECECRAAEWRLTIRRLEEMPNMVTTWREATDHIRPVIPSPATEMDQVVFTPSRFRPGTYLSAELLSRRPGASNSTTSTTVFDHPLCSICREEYAGGQNQRTLSCGHKFHTTYIETWLRTSDSYPYCRRTPVNG